MNIDEMIEKWEKQIALHKRVCEDALMYTKEDRLKNSHFAQAICAVLADFKQVKNLSSNTVLADNKTQHCSKCNSTNVIIDTDKLTEYQLEIRTRLREKFEDLQIEIGRGDRLIINEVVITGGVVIRDSRNRKDYENDIKFFSDEIKRQYLDKRKC